jgi:hypothetical protein
MDHLIDDFMGEIEIDMDENDIPIDPLTLKKNFDLYTTRQWYGYHRLDKNLYITDTYFQWLRQSIRRNQKNIENIIHEQNGSSTGLIDLMLVLVIDDEYCYKSLDHQLYIIAVAYVLHKYSKLLFSNLERKYLYMDKITQITLSIVRIVKERIAKNTLCTLGGVCVLGIVAYKCVCVFMK